MGLLLVFSLYGVSLSPFGIPPQYICYVKLLLTTVVSTLLLSLIQNEVIDELKSRLAVKDTLAYEPLLE